MTIAELRTCPRQTKQYLEAQLLVIGYAKVVNTQRGQRNVQELQVVDRQGQQDKIAYWFDTNKPDMQMSPNQINQWLQWVVKTKPNGQYLNISGYPERAIERGGMGSPPPQTQQRPATQAQQALNLPPHPPIQQTYTPPRQVPPENQHIPSEWDKPVDWHNKKQLYIIRQSSIANAIKYQDGTELTIETTLAIAKRFAKFVYDGLVPSQGGQPNPDYSDDPDAPPGDDVPF